MSASARNILPQEVIETILILLPAKSLGRFKSVSKTWNSLISEPRFVKNHIHQTKKQSKLILVNNKNSLYSMTTDEFLSCPDDIPSTAKELSFGSPPMQWKDEIFGSCNGLVLSIDVDFNMFVINPTTRELWKLPTNPFKTEASRLTRGRYCDMLGFGYDSVTDDYKVVQIFITVPRSKLDTVSTISVSVYSLRNNSWRVIPNVPHDYPTCGGALVNDKYHWLTSSSVVAFSFDDEVFTEIKLKLPESFQEDGIGLSDGVVEICAKLGAFWGETETRCYEFWVMQEYGDPTSWSRVYFHHGDAVRPVFWSDEGEVVVYNIYEGACRDITIVGAFVESIESPARIVATP